MSTVSEVIAVAGVRPPPPWVLLESSTFSGRYYFFNTTTLESKWSLPETMFESDQPSSGVTNQSDHHGNLNSSLAAAQQAVRRMEARYGASPSRPDSDDETSAHLASSKSPSSSSNSPSKATASFTKRSRDLDPRLVSIDIEEHLTSALNKADKIEQRWKSLSIKEEENKKKKGNPTASSKPMKKSVLPSAEAFNAMNIEEGFGEDNDNDDNVGEEEGYNSGGHDDSLSRGVKTKNGNTASELSQSYIVINGLGSGGYSNVLLVSNVKKPGELMAMKVLSKKLLKRPRDRARLRNELRALTEIPPSPFIERCYSAFETPSHVCFVTE